MYDPQPIAPRDSVTGADIMQAAIAEQVWGIASSI